MIAPILKVVAAGILGGILLFAIPFILFRVVFFFLFIGFIFRLIAGRRARRWRRFHPYYSNYEVVEPFRGKEEGLHDHFNQNPKQI
ncbi:hypothetical protein [Dyadobacter luticola]|uniref:Uncharacterized protein n=1 Tax=Dyadobacter luticola TaxID=1979387 RepID=A0A5R9KYE1_9BACT|nr:hypothetical protein [Dyadobacter luticola]TLV01095.1 hypothetical protein FEN17_16710 [Dyadobacter luticola]